MSERIRDENTLLTKIKDFISEFGPFNDEHELIKSIKELLLMQKQLYVRDTDYRMITRILNEMKRSMNVFGRYSDHRKVCLFGSARTPSDHPDYQLAEAFSKKVTEAGIMVITGAGSGIMEAGNKGARANMSFGVNIELPFEQDANPYIAGDPKLVNYRYFFTRKLAFIKESDATVLLPGGFGTHDECFEALTLTQTGRCSPRPLILLAPKGSTYWETWVAFVKKELLDTGLISPDDMSLFAIAPTADDAVNMITTFYSVYHSIVYMEKFTVIRLNREISKKTLKDINTNFKHLLSRGEFELKTPEEIPDDSLYFANKPRLKFSFNRKEYGTLHKLIQKLNED